MRGWLGLGLVLLAVGQAEAQNFQVVVALTPPNGGTQQEIYRYNVAGTGGAMTRLSDIPASATNDPSALAFRTPSQLFVANRHSNSGVPASVSTFDFSSDFNSFSQGPTITGNGLRNAHGIAFDNVNGEMFVVNALSSTLSRFAVDPSGNATGIEVIALPADARGVATSSDGSELFVSLPNSSHTILRYERSGGGFTAIAPITVSGGSDNLHFMKFREGELYIGDIAGQVRRIGFDAGGNPIEKASILSDSPVDMAFSPDGQEMFVSNHLGGGDITRYLYNAPTDTWLFTSRVDTPSLGGIATTYGAVPEPGTLLALGAGLAVLVRRRRAKK